MTENREDREDRKDRDRDTVYGQQVRSKRLMMYLSRVANTVQQMAEQQNRMEAELLRGKRGVGNEYHQ